MYITEITDRRLLAALSSASKYNEDNPSWDTSTKGPYQAKFWQAMHVELNNLIIEFKCWGLVPRLPHMNVLLGTQAFKIKRFPDGTVKKFKAHLCARYDHQNEGISFFETWAPIVRWSTNIYCDGSCCNIRSSFSSLFVILRLLSSTVNFPPIKRYMYVHQPHGFKCGNGTEVLRLKCTLYFINHMDSNAVMAQKSYDSSVHSMGSVI